MLFFKIMKSLCFMDFHKFSLDKRKTLNLLINFCSIFFLRAWVLFCCYFYIVRFLSLRTFFFFAIYNLRVFFLFLRFVSSNNDLKENFRNNVSTDVFLLTKAMD